MSAPGAGVRRVAALALHRVRFAGASMKTALQLALPQLADARDRALCEAMVIEGCRWLHRYEFVLHRLLDHPLAHKLSRIHALLLAGLAQLDALQMPPYAAIGATAEAARALQFPAMVGLVNAVLRRYDREREALQAAWIEDADARDSHPAWLRERLRGDWPQHAEAVLAANNQAAPLWLRVDLRRGDAAGYREELARQGFAARLIEGLPAALQLHERPAPTGLPGWDAGRISVQDGSAQWAVAALQAQPGQRVLDACAAPGGKAAALLQSQPGLRVLALDQSAERAQRMLAGFARQGLPVDGDALAVREADATRPADWWDGRAFERILLDAPCSATGVIRRQPDIKWHRRAEDVAALAAQQARLLDALWPLLAPGGRLLYATCSVLAQENAEQVRDFLARTPQARLAPLDARYGHDTGAGHQRLPGEDAMDGFFCAALERAG